MVERGRMRVVRGPKENRHRPAADPLFRSAALAYRPCVVGVVLTGSLDDGTAGLAAIKERGGIAIVQDPTDAFYPGMPQSALDSVSVDYCVPVADLGRLLARLASEPAPDAPLKPVRRELELEVKIAGMDSDIMHSPERPGRPSAVSCPECNGVLWEVSEGELTRFRCRVGHAFSAESVLAEQSEALETALWVALNTLQENADLARRMAAQARQRNQTALARRFQQKVDEAESRITLIRQVLLKEETIAGPDAADGPSTT